MSDSSAGRGDGRRDGDREPLEPTSRRPDPELGSTMETQSTRPELRSDEPPPGGDASGRQASLWGDAWQQLRRKPLFVISASLIVVLVLMAAFPRLFTVFYPGLDDPTFADLGRSLERPSSQHWFGFDVQGRDYFARTIHGARVSISIGVVVMLFSTMIAVIFGSLAAYYGGFLDTIIARIADIWFALPFILGGIVILSVLDRSFRNVALVLILLGWPTMLRLMRSSVLSAKEQDYVEAARALGARDGRIIFKHILPNAMAPVIVYATIYVGIIINAEAALSYLGVGLQLPAISWGLMINESQHRILSAPHLLLFPGLFLSVAIFSFILMGDALRDALDPKLR